MDTPDRADVDNAAIVCGEHSRQNRLNCVKASAEIHGKHAVPGFRCNILKLDLPRNTCIVDKQRDPSEFAFCMGNHFPHRSGICNIRLQSNGCAAAAAQLRDQILRFFTLFNIIDAYCISCAGKGTGSRGSDAP